MTIPRTLALALLLASCTVPALAAEDIILSDGDITVTRADLDAAFASLNTQQRRALREQPDEAQALAKRVFFRKAISRFAEAEGFDEDPRTALVVRQRQESLLARERLRQVEQDAVADQSVSRLAREHYQANRREYRTREEAEARHILFSTAETDAGDARTAAEELRERIASGDIEFADAAREYSEDPGSSASGGDLGRFARGRMVGPFEDTVFSLPPGQLSQPVETEFGFHLIEVQNHHPARQRDFEEVEDEIRAQLAQRLRRDARNNHLSGLRANENVAVNWELVERLQERFSATGDDG